MLLIVVVAVFVIHFSAWLPWTPTYLRYLPTYLPLDSVLAPSLCSVPQALHPDPEILDYHNLQGAPVRLRLSCSRHCCAALNSGSSTGITSSQRGAPQPVTRPLPPFCLSTTFRDLRHCISSIQRIPIKLTPAFLQQLSASPLLLCQSQPAPSLPHRKAQRARINPQ